jgi:SAM-dependent methyltransferase
MISLRKIVAKLRWSLHTRGARGTIATAIGRLRSNSQASQKPQIHPFDVEHKVDTSGFITGPDLASHHPNSLLATGYYGIPPSRFRHILDRWAATLCEIEVSDYTFVDIGCGKGRAVLLASELPFLEVIGVELDTALAATATANLQSWRATHLSAAPTRILCADASSFAIPSTPCLLYLYNPFATPLVAALIEQVLCSFRDHPRTIVIVYVNPAADHLFAQSTSFERLWSGPLSISDADAAVDLLASPDDVCCAYRVVA